MKLLALVGDLRGVSLSGRFAFRGERRVFGSERLRAHTAPAVVIELRQLAERVGGAEGRCHAADR